jgi:hypothetical protein
MNGNVSPHLTASDTALSSQRWTIDWDDVTSVSIGQMPYVGGRSLRIESGAKICAFLDRRRR